MARPNVFGGLRLQRPGIAVRHPLRFPCLLLNQTRLVSTDMGSKMLKSNRLKQVFLEGKRPAMGVWQMLPGSNVSRILARSGADWVMVDCEHGNIDGKEAQS